MRAITRDASSVSPILASLPKAAICELYPQDSSAWWRGIPSWCDSASRPIAEATAERDRARAELAAARLEARQRLIEGLREREQLLVRVARDSALVLRAQRVATRAITAYAEGASALPAVLEARRSAREVLAQYIDDTAALLIVTTELRALTQTLPGR